MKTGHIHHLVEKGRILRGKGITWRAIAMQLNILTSKGDLDPGMAYKIISGGYEPKRYETRQRLGLPPVCISCKQKLP